MRHLFIFVSLMMAAASAATSAQGPLQAELKAALVRSLERTASSVDGVTGYVVTDLTTHDIVAARLNAELFPTASAIKLAILYELLKQGEEGALALDTPVPVNPAQVVGGSGVLQYLTRPLLSLRDQAALMMIVSDNSSTNIVIDAVAMDKVNARMAGLGLRDVRLRRRMMDADAVKRGDENVATPSALARIAEMLWRGEGLRPDSRDAARQILRRVGGQIREGVPASVPVFSKTGGLAGVRAEAAVVEADGRPFSIAVMTTYLARESDGERAIRDMASAAFSYFDRLAHGGAYGRK